MGIREWIAQTESSSCRPIDAAFVADPPQQGFPLGRGKRPSGYVYSIRGDMAMTLLELRGDGSILCSSEWGSPYSVDGSGFDGSALPEEHRHDYIEIAYVYKGRLKQRINGSEQVFEEGEVCVIDRETFHREDTSGSENLIVFLCLGESFFDEPFLSMLDDYYIGEFLRVALRGQAKRHRFLRFSPREAGPDIEGALDRILEEYEGGARGSKYIIKGLVLRLLDILISSYDSRITEAQAESYDDAIFAELDSYLKANYRRVSIGRLTKAFKYNPDFYNRLIRKRTGMTYSRYLQSIRLTEAERLLRESDMPIDSVASEIGYENKGFFYKIFAAKNGLRPNEYRQRHKTG